MKHLKFNPFLLTLLLSMAGITAAAHDIEVKNEDGKTIYYLWTNNNTELAVSLWSNSYMASYNGYSGNVVIPESVTYNGMSYPVTSIGSQAFRGCFGLTSVTIPNSVTSIGWGAFYGCSALTSVTIPNSVASIGNSAFYNCSGLTSVTIPNSVTSIGNSAFEGCSGLENMTVASGNSTYDSRDNCNAIIETASNTLIAGCKNAIIPNSVTSIGGYAFSSCSGLTSVTIPSSVTSIGGYAFSGCSGLTSVTIPSSVTSIGDDAFYNCSGLTSVTIPNSVTSIGNSAFRGCSSLTSVTIPNSVTSIGTNAFYGCSGLTSVTIPNSVTSIGSGAFSSCSGLENMTVASGNSTYDSRDNCNAIIETASNTLIAGCKCTIIPNSVTSIGSSAFSGCSSLTSVTIPNSVKSIGSNAFRGCSSLTSVTIPNSVKSIGGDAFSGCSSLTSVTIPNSVTSIGGDAFAGCSSLTSVTIPNSVTSIGSEAFRGCSSLTSVTIPNSVTSIGRCAFQYCSSLTSVDIPNSVTSIGDYAFQDCTGLTSVTIPNSVTSIGNYAFYGCTGLASVTIPNSVTSINSQAFRKCPGLTSFIVDPGNTVFDSRENCNAIIETATNTLVAGCQNTTIPSSVTSIGDYAFYECSSLTSVTIPNSVTSIGRAAFSGCSSLTSVTIPSSVTSINITSFIYCPGLEIIIVDPDNPIYDSRENCNAIVETASNTLVAGCQKTTVPNSVTSIGGGAFVGCSSLTSVTIPNSVTSIADRAFLRCYNLTSVTIGSSVTSIFDCAFESCSGLTDVFCYAENVPTTKADAFKSASISSATLHVPAASLSSYQTTEPWSGFGNIVGDIVLKCATPTIAFVDGILTFECETEGVEFVNTITASVDESSTGNNVPLPELKTTYHVSVYAAKEGYLNSDVATMDIDFQPKTGDVNGDGEVTIADAVAVVDIILNTTPTPKFYYSVGTEEVTADNYTTANDAQYKSSLSEIPETLDLSSINSQKAYIMLPEGCALVIRNAQGVVGTTSVALGNGHTVHTTTSEINGSECTCIVYK